MTEKAVVVLKEIRDSLKEDLEWRRKAVEESIHMQKKAVRYQRLALAFGFVLFLIIFGLLFLLRRFL